MKNKIKAIIVEDNRMFQDVIESFLLEVAPHVEIVAKSTTLKEARENIIRLSPQLVFFDIQFDEEGQTAFDLLKELWEHKMVDFQIVIITAFDQSEYYNEAFNYGVLHFLTKPIDKQKLKQAIDRVTANKQPLPDNQLFSQFLAMHEQIHTATEANKIVIESQNFSEVVKVDNIVYFEASGSYTNIYMINRQSQPICSTINLGRYEKKLINHPDFFRIHRNLIINSNYVLRYSKKDRSIVLPDPFPKQHASKERFSEFIKFLENSRLG